MSKHLTQKCVFWKHSLSWQGFAFKSFAFGWTPMCGWFLCQASTTVILNVHCGMELVCSYGSVKQIPDCVHLSLLHSNSGSSRAGKTSIIRDTKLRQEFVGASSKEEVFALARRFVTGIQNDNHQAGGWPNTMYGELCTLSLPCQPANGS